MDMINYNDKNEVQKYLYYHLTRPKLFKGENFYKNISSLYNYYPKTIIDVVNNLYKITYFNDYFKIIYYSKNDDLNKYIYNYLLDIINQDIKKFNNKQEISLLAKWLPRKGREYDKKLDFVKKFSALMFPNEKSILKRFILYKKTIVKLTNYINPIEINLSNKKYDNINFDKLTKNNIIVYNEKLASCSKKYVKYMNRLIENYDYDQFIDTLLWLYDLDISRRNKYANIINHLEHVWLNNFHKYTNINNFDITNKILIIDTNSNMLNMRKDIIKLILIFIFVNNKIILNNKKIIIINKNNSIFKTIDDILINMRLCKNINLDNINDLEYDNKTLVVLTSKKINKIINSNNKLFQYIYFCNKPFIQNNNNSYEGNIFYKKIVESEKQILIKKILYKSKELKSRKNRSSKLNKIEFNCTTCLMDIGIVILVIILYIGLNYYLSL